VTGRSCLEGCGCDEDGIVKSHFASGGVVTGQSCDEGRVGAKGGVVTRVVVVTMGVVGTRTGL